MTSRISFLLLSTGLLIAGGCKPLFDIRKAMYDQPKYEPLEVSDFFGDRRSARPEIAGTVAQGQLKLDDHLHLGLEAIDGEMLQARTFPFEITLEDLERGRERYNIYCSVCHGLSGHGEGMVVRRGYKAAPGFHSDKLRDAHPGYFFSVITNGYGQMSSYAAQIPVEDRWRIVAYIRALQRSQFASIEDYEAVKALISTDEPSEPVHEHH